MCSIRLFALLRLVASLGLLSVLAACATPDVKPFADQTANLASAVEVERKATLDKFDEILAQIDMVAKVYPEVKLWPDQKDQWTKRKNRYKNGMKVVRTVLGEAVAYSAALVDLAEAGETGGKAVESIYETIKGFASVAGVASPPAELAGTVAGRVFKEVGEAWTRIQAQKSLRAAVLMVSAKDGAARKLESGIKEIFEDVQGDLILALSIAGRQLVVAEAGPARMGFYEAMTAPNRLERYFENLRKILPEATASRGICVNTETATPDPSCIAGEELQSIADLFAIIAVLEPDYMAYQKRLRALSDWSKLRRAKAKAIVSAVKVWGEEHEKLAVLLERCGGFRALRPSCGNLTAANLKLAVAKITYVIKDDGEE